MQSVEVVHRRRVANARASRWAFTLNNWTPDDHDVLGALVNRPAASYKVRYLIMGQETAPETGTPHLQGYLELDCMQSLVAIKGHIGLEAMHLEPARSDATTNKMYCKKGGHWDEFGAPGPGRGARTDLEAVKVAIDGGATYKDVAQNYFGAFVRYHRGLKEFFDVTTASPTRTGLCIRWWWGPTGTGKTRALSAMVSELETRHGWTSYWLGNSPTGAWWDGYTGQEIVVMDELRGSWMPHGFLLRVFDVKPYRVPIKGSSQPLTSTHMFVTTNLPPHMLYETDHAGALERRVADYAYVYEHLMDVCHVRSSPRVV